MPRTCRSSCSWAPAQSRNASRRLPTAATAPNIPALNFIAGIAVRQFRPGCRNSQGTVRAAHRSAFWCRRSGPKRGLHRSGAHGVPGGPRQRAGEHPAPGRWLGLDVVADAPGSYTLRAQIVESSTLRPGCGQQLDDHYRGCHASTAPPPPPPPPPPAKATARAVKLLPAKPKAGSLVSATVRVTAGGAPIRPTGVSCTGTLAGGKLKGTPKATSGTAACAHRTPKSGKGKTLREACRSPLAARSSRSPSPPSSVRRRRAEEPGRLSGWPPRIVVVLAVGYHGNQRRSDRVYGPR